MTIDEEWASSRWPGVRAAGALRTPERRMADMEALGIVGADPHSEADRALYSRLKELRVVLEGLVRAGATRVQVEQAVREVFGDR